MGSKETSQTATQEAFDVVFMLAVSGVISPVKICPIKHDSWKYFKYCKNHTKCEKTACFIELKIFK